jgi:hypothetical protein
MPAVKPVLIPRRGGAVGLAMAAALLLSGCQALPPWLRQLDRSRNAGQQQLEQALERCRQQQPQVELLLRQLQADAQAISTLEAERYSPSRKPQPPDPRLAARFSQLDRELDQERYDQEMARWSSREQQRQANWQQDHKQRLEQVQLQRSRHLAQLARLNPALAAGPEGRLDADAVRRFSLCRAEDLRS